jgi:hypothetical protein
MNVSRSQISLAALEFLNWAADDFTEAFVLRDILQRTIGPLSPQTERSAALEVVHELLEAGLIDIGDMRSDTAGLSFWEGSRQNLLKKLASEWTESQPPEMGAGPWFFATDKGKAQARSH